MGSRRRQGPFGLFLQKISMSRLPIFILCACLAACGNNPDRSATGAASNPSRHPASFNQPIQLALTAYEGLAEGLVNWDSAAVPALGAKLGARLDSLDLKADASTAGAQSALAAAKADLDQLQQKTGITAQRRAFHALSNHFYEALKSAGYDASPVYLQKCPMAFNDEETGNWISKVETIRNPYLGLHHPHYGKGMLSCGETKEALNKEAAKN